MPSERFSELQDDFFSTFNRLLSPTPDTDNSFHVKDPNGFDLQNGGKDMKPVYTSAAQLLAAELVLRRTELR